MRKSLGMTLSLLLLTGATPVAAAALCQSLPLHRLNARAWVARATGEQGFHANLSVIELARGVVVFNSGPGLHVAEKLRCSIAAEIRKPVLRVVLPQSLPENVLGSAAFPDALILSHASNST
jgi:hypothetical protein